MRSPEPRISGGDREIGGATLGEILAQEVQDSFKILTSTPETLISGIGIWGDQHGNVQHMLNSSSADNEGTVHESLHPLCPPLSYGGHIKVDSNSLGMVVKMDSRSRTSSHLMRLQFFSSEEDMVKNRDPLRVMHGYVAERATRARTKGMEFFKIEEADNTTQEATSCTIGGTLSDSTLGRLASAPSLARQGSGTTAASLGSASVLSQTMNARRFATTSRATAKGPGELHNQAVAKNVDRPKDESAHLQSTAFRSFVLPGVVDLWFRVEAPPGADKLPVHFISLVGSHEHTHEDTIRARRDMCGPSMMEEICHGDLGLKALFTYLGVEHAREEVLDRVTKSSGKGTDLANFSASSAPFMHETPMLPSCLAAAQNIRLTSGKWFYEVEIHSLSDQRALNACLLRVGWAHWEYPAEPHHSDSRRAKDKSSRVGSVSGATSTAGEDLFTQTSSDTISETSCGASERQECRKTLEPLRRTLEWFFESKESSSASHLSSESDRSIAGMDMRGGVDASSVTHRERNSARTRSSQLSRLESEGRRVLFPVLGSSTDKLGLGLDEHGFLWTGGHLGPHATQRLVRKDVVGCAVDIDSCSVWFSLNGVWTAVGHGTPRTLAAANAVRWDVGKAGMSEGIRPCLSLRGDTSVSVNFGATPFKHDPPDGFRPVILRDVPSDDEGCSGENLVTHLHAR